MPSWYGVAASVALVGIAFFVVMREQLGLGREVLIASARAAVQLVAVGALLLVLFKHTGLPGALAWVTAMVLLAGRVAGGRAKGLPHATRVATIGVAVGAAATLGLLLVARVIDTSGRVVVPVGGMVVTGAMQGASLTLQRMRDEASSGRRAVEARLALGLDGGTAFAPHLRTALRNALIPAIDGTKVVGLISLPGATVGLLLAGVNPLTAIRYQVVVMYMLLGGAAVAAVVAGRLAVRSLFDDAHRLRPVP
ncbi:MAG: UDP-glucose/iron transport system permease protein [Actinomycetota bacterium]|nr:UDP-glucose/iron transport system permease protein [Actinomycetota bacterium]